MPSVKKSAIEPRMTGKPPFSVEVAGYSQVPGETIPRRHPKASAKLWSSPEEGIETVFDIVKCSAVRFGNLKATGSRKLIKKHYETKKVKKVVDGKTQEVDKKWTYFEMSGYSYITFKEYETLVLQLGAGLANLGMKVQDRLHLFAATR
jgi:long-chain acyl-CoA synthetase